MIRTEVRDELQYLKEVVLCENCKAMGVVRTLVTTGKDDYGRPIREFQQQECHICNGNRVLERHTVLAPVDTYEPNVWKVKAGTG